jgi:splicing factor 3B subunit 4
VYVGGLDEQVTENMLWELFLQAGPVGELFKALFVVFHAVCMRAVNVHMPRDRITQQHQSYGFVEFMGEDDADYAIKIMNMIKIYGKPIRVNKVHSKCQVCHAC